MSDTIDSIANDIRYAVSQLGDDMPYIVMARQMRSLADDIVAAHKREIEATAAKCCQIGRLAGYGASEIKHQREPNGDAAKLREALESATGTLIRIIGCDHFAFHRNEYHCDYKTTMGECRNRNICETIFKAQSALSAPPRNCDRFATVDEARKAYEEYSRDYIMRASNKFDFPMEFEAWLFATATEKEGGNDAK